MGYLFLLIAAIFNMTKSYGSKKISGRVSGFSETVDISLCRNLFCAVIGAVIIALNTPQAFSMPLKGWIICLVAGVAVGTSYVVWVLALKAGVYVFANATNTASFMVAVFFGIFVFGEKLTLSKALAIVLIIIALLFMSKYQTETRGKITHVHLLLLVLVFVSQGFASATQKWFTYELPDMSVHAYTFYSLFISVIILTLFTFFIPNKPKLKQRAAGVKSFLPWITLMAICFYATTYFQTGASSRLDAVVMYPIYNGSLLVAGNIMAWLCFSEKPSKNSIIGAILVFAAVVLSGI